MQYLLMCCFEEKKWEAIPEAQRGTIMQEYGAANVIIDGEVIEADPPRRLVQTWRALFSPEMAAEGPTRLTNCLKTRTHSPGPAAALKPGRRWRAAPR